MSKKSLPETQTRSGYDLIYQNCHILSHNHTIDNPSSIQHSCDPFVTLQGNEHLTPWILVTKCWKFKLKICIQSKSKVVLPLEVSLLPRGHDFWYRLYNVKITWTTLDHGCRAILSCLPVGLFSAICPISRPSLGESSSALLVSLLCRNQIISPSLLTIHTEMKSRYPFSANCPLPWTRLTPTSSPAHPTSSPTESASTCDRD